MYIENKENLREILKDSKVLICDLDGAIIDSEVMHFKAWKDTLSLYIGISITEEDIKRYISHDDYSICNMVKEDYTVNFVDDFIIEKRRERFESYLETEEFKKNELLSSLIKDSSFCKNYKYLVTSQDINLGQKELENIGLERDFNMSYWNVQDKSDIYDLIVSNLVLDKGIKDGYVLVEDSLKYIEIGKNLGFKVIGVEHKYNKDKFEEYIKNGNSLDIIRM